MVRGRHAATAVNSFKSFNVQLIFYETLTTSLSPAQRTRNADRFPGYG